MTKVYRHIGYYNTYKDCKYLFSKSADDAVEYMKLGMGEFHHCEPEIDTDVTDIEPDEKFFKITTDKKYKVRYEKGVDDENVADCGWYIDFYELYSENTSANTLAVDEIEEYCGHCEEYVHIKDTLMVQICPNCGKAIVPCSICPKMDGKSYSEKIICSSCPLGVLCMIKNGEHYVGTEHTLESFVEEFNALDHCDKSRGYYCTIPKDKEFENSCDEEIYIHYNVDYESCVLMDAKHYGKSYMWGMNEEITASELFDALWHMFGREINKLYARQQ